MSDEGRGFLQKRSSLLRGYTDLKAEVNANIRQDQEDRLLRREKFDSLFGGSVRGDQIRYDNDGLRTNNELLASKESAKTYRNLSNSINKETLNAGRDIQRADFETTVLQKELIKEYVTASTKEALQSELSGEKYIKTRMNDKSLKALIDKVRLKGQNILDSDEYLKDSGLYAGNNLAMQKLAEREQMIRNVVDDTINHINDIRESRGMPPYVGHSEQDSYVFGKDMTNIIEVKQKDYSIDASFQQQQDATPVPDKHDKFKLTEADVKPEAHSKPESSVSHRSSGSEESTTQESSSNSSESSDDGSSRTPNKKPDNDSASSSSSSSNATKPKR